MAACRHRRAKNTWSGSDIATRAVRTGPAGAIRVRQADLGPLSELCRRLSAGVSRTRQPSPRLISNSSCLHLSRGNCSLSSSTTTFLTKRGPASRGTRGGVRVNDCLRLGQGDARPHVLALPLRTCFLVRRSAGSAGGRVYRSGTMTLKEAMIRRANGRGRRSGAVEAVVA